MRVEGAVRPHRTIRNKRQNDKGGTSEDQNVVEFIFCKHRADKAVEPGSRGKQNGHDDGEAACERGLLR